MRQLFVFVLAVGCFGLVGCGGSPGSDAGIGGDAPAGDAAPTDTASVLDAPPVATLSHYAPCDTTAECPAGDVCAYMWPSTDPVPEPPPVAYCQPPCTAHADCTSDAYGDPTITGFCEEERCMLYCAVGGIVPTCEGAWRCAYWNPSAPRDGYCVLPE